jgi:hypothetical protein
MAVPAALLAMRVMLVMLEGPGIREIAVVLVQVAAAEVVVAVPVVIIRQTPQSQATPP